MEGLRLFINGLQVNFWETQASRILIEKTVGAELLQAVPSAIKNICLRFCTYTDHVLIDIDVLKRSDLYVIGHQRIVPIENKDSAIVMHPEQLYLILFDSTINTALVVVRNTAK